MDDFLTPDQSAYGVLHATAVGVEQPAQEVGRVGLDDLFLPGFQGNPAVVLAPRSVLREQAHPVLPGTRGDDAPRNQSGVWPPGRLDATHQILDPLVCLGIDAIVVDV